MAGIDASRHPQVHCPLAPQREARTAGHGWYVQCPWIDSKPGGDELNIPIEQLNNVRLIKAEKYSKLQSNAGQGTNHSRTKAVHITFFTVYHSPSPSVSMSMLPQTSNHSHFPALAFPYTEAMNTLRLMGRSSH